MGAHELAGDRQTQPATAGTSRAEKRPEQIFPRLGRQTVAIIGNIDRNCPALARGGKAQTVGTRLDGVAGEVEKNPVELIAVGADGEVGRDRAFDRQILLRDGELRADLVNQRREQKPAWREWRGALAGKIEGARA